MTAEDLDPEYFQDLLTHVDTHPNWDYSSSNSYSKDDIAQHFANHTGPAAVFEPAEGEEGVLQLRRVYNNDNALTGNIVNPLGPSMPLEPAEGSFADKLGRAYSEIVSQESTTGYVVESDPANDPVYVATVAVPADFDEALLDKALSDAHTINEEVNQLQNDLEGLVDTSLDG